MCEVKARQRAARLIAAFILIGGFATGQVLAEGCEDLADPGVLDPGGNAFVEAGLGTANASGGMFELDIPMDATVLQVFAYWSGELRQGDPGDSEITINGVDVSGTALCPTGPVYFFNFQGDVLVQGFRAELDLTEIPIGPGTNMITVDGMDFGVENSGVGLLAVIDDGSGDATLGLRDGIDLAFAGFPDPRRTTVEQVFLFDAAGFDRTANLVMMAGSIGEGRPNAVSVTPGVGPQQVFDDVFGQPVSSGGDGDLFDSVSLEVNVPAGANMLTVQALSVNNPGGFDALEASLNWLVGALSVPASLCGDGIVDSDLGETCDPPGSTQTNDNLCREDCTYCGDGVVDPGEECDPGSDPDCTLDCTIPPTCGDGFVDAGLGETCDPPGSDQTNGNVCRDDCTYCGDGVVDPGEECDPGNDPNCTLECTVPMDQGCTPGYWKNHPLAWNYTDYTQETLVGAVWSAADTYFPELGDDTLLVALDYGGGSGLDGAARILLRAATAALLNASHPDVTYTLSVQAIIDGGNSALSSGDRRTILELASTLDYLNNSGCPIGRLGTSNRRSFRRGDGAATGGDTDFRTDEIRATDPARRR